MNGRDNWFDRIPMLVVGGVLMIRAPQFTQETLE